MLENKVIMRFLDSFTGTNGVKDGGGNEMAGFQDGLGFQNLMTTWKIFKLLEKECNIGTQNRSIDEKNNILVAERLTLLGAGMKFFHDGMEHISGGIEIIARNVATGGIRKPERMPYLNENVDLTDGKGLPMIETSVKHDAANDPIFLWQYFVQQGVNKKDLLYAIQMTAEATKHLTARLKGVGLNLLDTKMEWGYINGVVILGDEISTGTSRLRFEDGSKPTEKQIYEAVMKL